MSGFFWAAGHLGWGLFAALVFTGLIWLAADVVWRARATRATRFVPALAGAWVVGIGLVVLVFYLVNR